MKYKNPYGQSSIKVFYKGLSGKKGYLNLIFSDVPNKYVAVRAFGSSLIVVLSSFLKNLFVNLNLKVLIPVQKNLVLLQQVLRSLILSWFLPVLKFQVKVPKKKFLLMN